MVGWCHLLNEHEFEQTLGVSEGQGSLASCSPWDHKELDTLTEQQPPPILRDQLKVTYERAKL